jgi:thioredoxin-like negative regulator of GroEL
MKQLTIIILSIIALLFSAILHLSAQSSSNKKETAIVLKDMHAFKTAQEMYNVAPASFFDRQAEEIIGKIDAALAAKKLMESQEVWSLLEKAEPYRTSSEVQLAMSKWIEMEIANIKARSRSSASISKLRSLSKAYKDKNFTQHVKESLEVLQSSPTNLDIRSNLGLTLIHLNKDLCAQYMLETAQRMSSKHLPSAINLGVVYERLGKLDEAQQIAEALLVQADEKELSIPEIRFNAAWYLNFYGDYAGAAAIFSRPAASNDRNREKYRSFIEVNKKQNASK